MFKRVFLLCSLFPLFLLGNPEGEPELVNIEVKDVAGSTEVIFTLSDYASSSDFTMDNKIVIDLLQTKSGLEGNLWELNRGGVESIALSYISSASLTRVVVERSGDFEYEISNPDVNTVTLTLASDNAVPFTPWSVGKSGVKKVQDKGGRHRRNTFGYIRCRFYDNRTAACNRPNNPHKQQYAGIRRS